jgi:hypothetical protein
MDEIHTSVRALCLDKIRIVTIEHASQISTRERGGPFKGRTFNFDDIWHWSFNASRGCTNKALETPRGTEWIPEPKSIGTGAMQRDTHADVTAQTAQCKRLFAEEAT